MGAHMKKRYDMQKFTIFLKPMIHERSFLKELLPCKTLMLKKVRFIPPEKSHVEALRHKDKSR